MHYAPHRRLRAREWGIDVLLCSPYKFFGPHLGVAAIRPDLARSLPADRVRPAEEDPPGHRFETGTQSHEAVAGATAAIDYLRSLGDGSLDLAFERIQEHEDALSRRFLDGLPDEVELYGIRGTDGRTPTFCFNVRGHSPRELAQRWATRASTSGTATTTPWSRSAHWVWPNPEERCARASCTTRRPARSTGCSPRSRLARLDAGLPAATPAGWLRCRAGSAASSA